MTATPMAAPIRRAVISAHPPERPGLLTGGLRARQ
jgi:hypothetical protein